MRDRRVWQRREREPRARAGEVGGGAEPVTKYNTMMTSPVRMIPTVTS
jgi:hypothetical protein